MDGGAASLVWNGTTVYSCALFAAPPGFDKIRLCLQWCGSMGASVVVNSWRTMIPPADGAVQVRRPARPASVPLALV